MRASGEMEALSHGKSQCSFFSFPPSSEEKFLCILCEMRERNSASESAAAWVSEHSNFCPLPNSNQLREAKKAQQDT